MRKFIRAAIVLVVLVAAYWSWALIGAAQLASVASQGDAEAVMQRIDLPALRRSVGSQIAHAYLEQNPQSKKLLSLEQGFCGKRRRRRGRGAAARGSDAREHRRAPEQRPRRPPQGRRCGRRDVLANAATGPTRTAGRVGDAVATYPWMRRCLQLRSDFSSASISIVATVENVSDTAYGRTIRGPWRIAPQV